MSQGCFVVQMGFHVLNPEPSGLELLRVKSLTHKGFQSLSHEQIKGGGVFKGLGPLQIPRSIF
jgi:hypothetical protein